MAAGLSLEGKRFNAFKQAFEDTLSEQLDPDLLDGVLLTDGKLKQQEMNLGLAEILREGGPWGQGVPEPLFD